MTPAISSGDTDSAVGLICFTDTYLTGGVGVEDTKGTLNTQVYIVGRGDVSAQKSNADLNVKEAVPVQSL